MAQLRHRPGLDLADALTGEAEVLGHLLERALAATVETEAQRRGSCAPRSSSTLSTLATSPGQQRRAPRRRTAPSRCGPRRSRRARRRRRHGRARRARPCRPRSGAPRRPCRAAARLRRPARPASACGRASPRAGAHLEQRGEHVAGVHGQPDHARRVGDAALDRLADPPGRVRRELEALAPVELVDRVDEAEVALLHDVEQGQPGRLVLLGDRDDEPQVRVHELAVRLFALADGLARACAAGRA